MSRDAVLKANAVTGAAIVLARCGSFDPRIDNIVRAEARKAASPASAMIPLEDTQTTRCRIADRRLALGAIPSRQVTLSDCYQRFRS